MSIPSTKLPLIHVSLPATNKGSKTEKKNPKPEKPYVQLTGGSEKTLFFLSQYGGSEFSGRVYIRIG